MKNIVERLVIAQKNRFLYPFAHGLLAFLAIEVPKNVVFGKNVRFVHRSPGTVIHPNTIIGDNVEIYQNVTIGLSRPWIKAEGGGNYSERCRLRCWM